MRTISRVAGLLGILLLFMAVVGRFHQEPTLTIIGQRFRALTFLVLANTMLTAGIYFQLLGGRNR